LPFGYLVTCGIRVTWGIRVTRGVAVSRGVRVTWGVRVIHGIIASRICAESINALGLRSDAPRADRRKERGKTTCGYARSDRAPAGQPLVRRQVVDALIHVLLPFAIGSSRRCPYCTSRKTLRRRYQRTMRTGREQVTLHSPEAQDFSGKTLEEALAWCLVWLMVKGTGHPKGLDWAHEIGVRPFRV
jgi:hypothetical protein